MKKIVSLLMVSSLTLIAFDVAKVYKQCAMCHGKKAEKVAVNSSVVLNSLSEEELKLKLYELLDGSSNMTPQFIGLHKAKLKGVLEEDVIVFSKFILNLK